MASFVMGVMGYVMGCVMGKCRTVVGLRWARWAIACAYARECISRTRIIVTIACASPARAWANAHHTRNTHHTQALARSRRVTGSRAPHLNPITL